jgi:hypothetical protein
VLGAAASSSLEPEGGIVLCSLQVILDPAGELRCSGFLPGRPAEQLERRQGFPVEAAGAEDPPHLDCALPDPCGPALIELDHCKLQVHSPNAFALEFRQRMNRRDDEPETAHEADTAGAAQVVPTEQGAAVLRDAESLEEGDRPVAVLADRSVALLVAAALPSNGSAGSSSGSLAPIQRREKAAGSLRKCEDQEI